ncbi:adenine deaminase [Flavisolibacter ginsenosidimutans]|uniref:Adenine deaminase n=1 Tax=Flavisolibacter ginsenosidimutans TaxID=661481 RepID=A0A5B8UN23_9BACT|nr:adenine deaminase [Flavisolibacter ginsenosidimutans]QEC58077.1 adenine deaminase [Flavisolibacter ginsenosidimutans]
MASFTITGNLVDVHQKKIYPAEIKVEGQRIASITPISQSPNLPIFYILPGFVDAHVHIESSMLIPSEFARLAVVHGTVATVSDPHEIANVCGMKGVAFMIENGNTVPFKFNFGAPSCVPATSFETAGAELTSKDVEDLLRREDVLYLSEMMNFPGVLNGDEEVAKKIAAAKKFEKPVDGHAPGLRGEEAKRYIDAGISTDHECFTAEEALEKLQHGMKILIREGSAAKNFEALVDLLNEHSDMMMFCSDDKHPDSLVEGHINQLCARAVAKDIDVFKVLQAACVNPVGHYKLKVGLVRENDFADFIVVKDLKNFEVVQTYVNGELVAENGKSLINRQSAISNAVNNFSCSEKSPDDFTLMAGNDPLPKFAIEALDGQLITNKVFFQPLIEYGNIVSDVANDVLKIVVVNRYKDAPIAKAFIKNFGLKKGAIASSVAHDSHNIVAVGVDDESLCRAVNLVIEKQGGVSCVGNEDLILSLPVAGLMSAEDGYEVAKKYSEIDKAAKALGSTLSAPFMTLSFMALLVIPHLKLSDKGLFDGDNFSLINQSTN